MSACLYGNEGQNYEGISEDQVQENPVLLGTQSGSRLLEIEEELESAETRYSNLKDQSDYMKQIYGTNNKIAAAKSRKISSIVVLPNKTSDNPGVSNTSEAPKGVRVKKPVAIRQKSTAIETDSTGAAVNTINNILTGITNSVNRLSDIHTQMLTPKIHVSSGMPSSEIQNEKEILEKLENQIQEEILSARKRPETRAKSKSNFLTNRGNSLKTKATSQIIFKKSSKVEKRNRPMGRPMSILERKPSALLSNKYLNKPLSRNSNNLVEIYHNAAVTHTESEETTIRKSRQQAEAIHVDKMLSLNLNLDGMSTVSQKKPFAASTKSIQNYFIHNRTNDYNLMEMANENIHNYDKNYELPTASSKMKQVAKKLLGTLNLKTIPFCVATSTTQSHNIGINIQQVMNIIKNRQPINGISPTLAHNIELAAERINSKPFSDLVSTITSRIGHTVSKCPLSNTYLDLQKLQEQAKLIPEETIEEVDEETVDTPDTKIITITGPSGDMQIKTKNTPVWKEEKNASTCTCVTPFNAINIQQMAKKYNANTDTSVRSQAIDNPLKPRINPFGPQRKNRFHPKSSAFSNIQIGTFNREQKIPETVTDNENTLKTREKNLRGVLQNLHDDFELLNKKYLELSEKHPSEDDTDTINQLETLDTELNKKEEEIATVMALYKEVLALKRQVKQLKEKKSIGNLRQIERKEAKANFKEYNNPEAAFHLTKLLKQIQHYQMKYKSNLHGE